MYNCVWVAAQSRAMLPVFCGISGSTRATLIMEVASIGRRSPGALIIIFQTNNIVFAQIVAELYFNNCQRFRPAVSQPMIGLWGNVDVLTSAELQFLVTTNDVGDALDYYPVFTSSGMPLQAQPCSWSYFEHFHLKPRPFFQDFVATPWPFIEFPHQDFLPC